MKYLGHPLLRRRAQAAMLVPLAVIAFWPSPVDQPVQSQLASVLRFLHTHGIPTWFNYQFVEASANVALFIPLGAVAALAYPKKSLWQVGIFGLIVSACIELGQLLFLHNRFASPLDLVTNTGGVVIGALLVAAAHKLLQAGRCSAAGLEAFTEEPVVSRRRPSVKTSGPRRTPRARTPG